MDLLYDIPLPIPKEQLPGIVRVDGFHQPLQKVVPVAGPLPFPFLKLFGGIGADVAPHAVIMVTGFVALPVPDKGTVPSRIIPIGKGNGPVLLLKLSSRFAIGAVQDCPIGIGGGLGVGAVFVVKVAGLVALPIGFGKETAFFIVGITAKGTLLPTELFLQPDQVMAAIIGQPFFPPPIIRNLRKVSPFVIGIGGDQPPGSLMAEQPAGPVVGPPGLSAQPVLEKDPVPPAIVPIKGFGPVGMVDFPYGPVFFLVKVGGDARVGTVFHLYLPLTVIVGQPVGIPVGQGL